jgi:alpha-tubulin suppressor-like RCC1 family protein
MPRRTVLSLSVALLAACVPSYAFQPGDDGGPDATTGEDAAVDAPHAVDATADHAVLGDGGPPPSVDGAPPPLAVLSAGHSHTCVLRDAGTVVCWGDDSQNELGRGPANPDASDYRGAPVYGANDAGGVLSSASEVQSGYGYSCALVAGTPYCWGGNDSSMLGNNDQYTQRAAPVAVLSALNSQPLTGIQRLAVGRIAACAQTQGGHWLCWGDANAGQLTTDIAPSGGNVSQATEVPGLNGAIDVVMGYAHGCAINADRTVSCWGKDDYRQTGQPSTAICGTAPYTVTCQPHVSPVAGLSNVQALGLADNSSCALDLAGAVRCWGSFAAGELGTFDGDAGSGDAGSTCAESGDASAPCSEVPQLIALPRPAVSISGGEDWNGAAYCAVLDDGTLACWGSDASGELAINQTTSAPNPTPTKARDVNGPLTGVTVVASGDTHKCALLADGGLLCWGMTDPNQPDGRLGTVNISQPYAIPVAW